MFSENFYLDIEKIHIAHEFILDRIHRCEYPSGRGHYGLVYVLNGKAEYRFFTGERITVTDGDTLFLSPNCAYSIVTEKEFKHYTVNFDIHEDTSRLDFLNKPYSLLQEENSEQLKRKFIELTTTWTPQKSGFEMRSVGYLYELLSQFYFEYTKEQNSVIYQRLLPAKEYIEQHFKDPITLEQLAFISNMSVTNFRREWKKYIRIHRCNTVIPYGFITLRNI